MEKDRIIWSSENEIIVVKYITCGTTRPRKFINEFQLVLSDINVFFKYDSEKLELNDSVLIFKKNGAISNETKLYFYVDKLLQIRLSCFQNLDTFFSQVISTSNAWVATESDLFAHETVYSENDFAKICKRIFNPLHHTREFMFARCKTSSLITDRHLGHVIKLPDVVFALHLKIGNSINSDAIAFFQNEKIDVFAGSECKSLMHQWCHRVSNTMFLIQQIDILTEMSVLIPYGLMNQDCKLRHYKEVELPLSECRTITLLKLKWKSETDYSEHFLIIDGCSNEDHNDYHKLLTVIPLREINNVYLSKAVQLRAGLKARLVDNDSKNVYIICMQYRSNHLEFIIANQNLAINLCQIIKSIALLRPPINRSSHVTLINRKTVKIALEYDISLKGYLTLERKHTDFHSMEKIEKKSETDEMASHYETDFKFYYIGKKMNKLISYMNPIISANDIAEYLPERIRKKIMVKSRKQDNEVSSFPDYNRDSLTYKGGSTIQTKRSTWCGNNIDNIEKTDLNRRSLRKSQSLNNFDQLYESQNRMRGFSKNNQDSQSSDSAIKF